ncbi:MAG: extracellular solute-binding protein [Chloroflexi bacterium]|nr:extracellular solute-binding protein [Chloroflexota bacterium]
MAKLNGLSRRDFLKAMGAVAAGSALAACAPQTPATQAPAAETTPEAAPMTGEIVLWIRDFWGGDMPDDMVAMFNDRDLGFTAKWELGDFDENTKIMSALAAGNPPPVAHLGRWQVGDMAVRNAVVPLDEYIAQSETFKWDNVWDRMQVDCTMFGKKWTVPLSTDTRAFFWNKRLMEEAGLDPEAPPTTWEQVLDVAPKLTVRDEGGRLDQIGFTPSFANPPVYLMFCSVLWCKGGAIVDDAYTQISIADQEGIEAMQYLKDLMDAQGGYEDAVAFTTALTPGENLDAFTIEKVAMMMNGQWVFTDYDKYAPDLEYGIMPGPVFEGMDEHCNYDGGGSFFIFKEGGKPEMAWKFIETMMEDDILVPLSDTYNLLPGTKSASAEYEKMDERRPVFVETANEVKWIPVFSGTLETLGAMATMFDNVLIGGADIASELAAAQDKMQVILDRHNSFPPPV